MKAVGSQAKKYPRLLEFRATCEVPPSNEGFCRVRIETPGGRVINPEEAGASEEISAMIGKPLRLERAQSHRREKTGIDPATVFGDVPVEDLKPGFTAQTLPDYFELKEGTFFEVAALHVLASASVEHLPPTATRGSDRPAPLSAQSLHRDGARVDWLCRRRVVGGNSRGRRDFADRRYAARPWVRDDDPGTGRPTPGSQRAQDQRETPWGLRGRLRRSRPPAVWSELAIPCC